MVKQATAAAAAQQAAAAALPPDIAASVNLAAEIDDRQASQQAAPSAQQAGAQQAEDVDGDTTTTTGADEQAAPATPPTPASVPPRKPDAAADDTDDQTDDDDHTDDAEQQQPKDKTERRFTQAEVDRMIGKRAGNLSKLQAELDQWKGGTHPDLAPVVEAKVQEATSELAQRLHAQTVRAAAAAAGFNDPADAIGFIPFDAAADDAAITAAVAELAKTKAYLLAGPATGDLAGIGTGSWVGSGGDFMANPNAALAADIDAKANGAKR